jgi:hypothetical protein
VYIFRDGQLRDTNILNGKGRLAKIFGFYVGFLRQKREDKKPISWTNFWLKTVILLLRFIGACYKGKLPHFEISQKNYEIF